MSVWFNPLSVRNNIAAAKMLSSQFVSWFPRTSGTNEKTRLLSKDNQFRQNSTSFIWGRSDCLKLFQYTTYGLVRRTTSSTSYWRTNVASLLFSLSFCRLLRSIEEHLRRTLFAVAGGIVECVERQVPLSAVGKKFCTSLCALKNSKYIQQIIVTHICMTGEKRDDKWCLVFRDSEEGWLKFSINSDDWLKRSFRI